MSASQGRTSRTLRGRLIALVATLLALLLAIAVSTLVVRLQVRAADNRVDGVLVPAQNAAAALSHAYVDMESGERGFALTGDPAFLQPYEQGQRDAARARADLGRLLRGDRVALRQLAGVDAAGGRWLSEAARPDIADRRAGRAPTGAALEARARNAKVLFDDLRDRLSALSKHVSGRVAAEIRIARGAQSAATWVAIAAMAVAVVVSVVAGWLLRRALTAPLARLVRQVEKVAGGDLEHPLDPVGTTELDTVAGAVDRMRRRILADTAAVAETREQIATYAEGDRIARDLHDRVIQRLFAAGMRLESAASRQPALREVVQDTVDELDRSIRELRTVIFGLTAHQAGGGVRDRVLTLVRESERSLGFAPRLHFEGAIEVAADQTVAEAIVPALGEMLSNVARHARASTAQVQVEASAGWLRVVVSDDGVGPVAHDGSPGRGLGNLRDRAEELGGSFALLPNDGGGTVATWAVPTGRDPSG